MSNSFGYNISITPSPTTITINVSVTGTQLTVGINTIPTNIDFKLVPTGDFGQQIEDAIVTPLIEIGAGNLSTKIQDALNGKQLVAITVPAYSGDGITITPSKLSMSANTTATGVGMLQLTGTLTLS